VIQCSDDITGPKLARVESLDLFGIPYILNFYEIVVWSGLVYSSVCESSLE